MTYSKEQVQKLVKHYNILVKEIISGCEAASKEYTTEIQGKKYIQSAQYRLWLRKLNVEVQNTLEQFE